MQTLLKVLEYVLQTVKSEAIDPHNIQKSDYNKFYSILDKLPYLIWFTEQINPIYLNRKGRDYYQISLEDIKNEQNLVFTRYLHPDTLFLVSQTNQNFEQSPEKEVISCYKIYDTERNSKWIANITKALQINDKGLVGHCLHIAIDVNEILEKSDFVRNIKTIEISEAPSISNREYEVLQLIAKEFTTAQIADKLFIGKDAVNYHRKNLLKKFNSSSSIGLVLAAREYHLI